jgi:hypothetical protein
MNRKRLISTFQQIRDLAEESLADLGHVARVPHKSRSSRIKGQASPKTLPSWIRKLRDEGLFKKPQTAKEAHAKIQTRFPCDLNRVAVALLRLQKRKQLRKVSKGVGDKKQVAYVW